MFDMVFGEMRSDDKVWAIFWICVAQVFCTLFVCILISNLFGKSIHPLSYCFSSYEVRNSQFCVTLAQNYKPK